MRKSVAVCAVVSLASAALADTQGVTLTDQFSFSNGQWSLGYAFSVNSPIAVTRLSVWDDLGNGFNSGALDVALWDSAGNLLSSATVTSADALSADNFRSVAVTPVTLTVGQTYIVAAQNLNDLYHYDFGAPNVAPEINWITDRFAPGAGLQFPTNSSGGVNGWYGGNFSFSVVPLSPAAWMGLGGLACVGGVGAVRRRRLAAARK